MGGGASAGVPVLFSHFEKQTQDVHTRPAFLQAQALLLCVSFTRQQVEWRLQSQQGPVDRPPWSWCGVVLLLLGMVAAAVGGCEPREAGERPIPRLRFLPPRRPLPRDVTQNPGLSISTGTGAKKINC